MIEIAAEILNVWQRICYALICVALTPIILLYSYDIIVYLWKLLDYGCRWSVYIGRKSSTPSSSTHTAKSRTNPTVVEHQPEESSESLLNDSPDYHYHSDLKSKP